MKKLLIAMVAVLVSAASFGQGEVVFNTRVSGSHDAPVYLPDGVTPAGAHTSPIVAQLFVVGTGGALIAIPGSANFRQTPAGLAQAYIVPPPSALVVPGVASGAEATLRMLAWDSTYADFTAAEVANGLRGFSQDFTITVGGGTLPSANLTGLQGFPLVPEPSTMVLGLIGAAALLFRRRK